jgi:hypothetical protein
VTTAEVTTTAQALLARVGPFGPRVEGGELVFDRDLPEELVGGLTVLHTGVRAASTGRPWWGASDIATRRPRVEVLAPDTPVPDWCGLLCVEVDRRWDRIDPAARIDLPGLFALATGRGP